MSFSVWAGGSLWTTGRGELLIWLGYGTDLAKRASAERLFGEERGDGVDKRARRGPRAWPY